MAQRVLSGIRATGRLHVGNYLGAVKGMLTLQDDPAYETFYMVADVHALTTPYKVEELAINRREVVIDYLSVGLDPNKSTLFLQADVSEHAELAFYLSSLVTIARMQHLPTFKDKVKQHPDAATMALLNYPILMASDILLYQATYVPVGIDQEPHIEVAREIARSLNTRYGLSFPEPKRFVTPGQYVPSLTGEGKMGKSVEGSYILLSDDLETIKKRIAKVPTSSTVGGEMTGGLKTLFTLAQLFMPDSWKSYEAAYSDGTLKYADLKHDLSVAIYKELEPIQKRREAIAQDLRAVDAVIEEGALKAKRIASQTVQSVRAAFGLS
jgi:tryptophanyl-tRNA synthetase